MAEAFNLLSLGETGGDAGVFGLQLGGGLPAPGRRIGVSIVASCSPTLCLACSALFLVAIMKLRSMVMRSTRNATSRSRRVLSLLR